MCVTPRGGVSLCSQTAITTIERSLSELDGKLPPLEREWRQAEKRRNALNASLGLKLEEARGKEGALQNVVSALEESLARMKPLAAKNPRDRLVQIASREAEYVLRKAQRGLNDRV